MLRRWANAIQLNGIDSEILMPEQINEIEPLLDTNGRFPVVGGFIQNVAASPVTMQSIGALPALPMTWT